MWVVHKAGFSGGRVQKTKTVREEDETPMCKVKLDHGGEIITIEEDSVEKVSQRNQSHKDQNIYTFLITFATLLLVIE